VLIRLGKLLSIVACVYLAGGHWAVLQTAAWAGMLADYSRSYGMEKAVAMTFDGDHPCPLCRKIESAKKRESAPDHPVGIVAKSARKDPAFPLTKRVFLRSPDFSRTGMRIVHMHGTTRCETPPLPPPRLAT
jgi:hypothetical protein